MRVLVRKGVLALHITVSVGWVGDVFPYLAFVIAAWQSPDPQTLRATWIAMELIGWYVLVPLALGALGTGLVMGVGTHWGLLQHYWVVFSLILTVVAAAVLIGHMPTVSSFAVTAATSTHAARRALRGELLHAGGGLVVLLTIVGLNVFKPPGRTPYGQRKQ